MAKQRKQPAAAVASIEKDDAPLCQFIKCTVETVHRSKIKEAPYNPRGMNDEERSLLDHNIETKGLLNYLVWNKRSGNLVSGHQRLLKLDKLMKTQNYRLPVNVVDLDDKEEKNQNVFFNNPAAQGAFDLTKLGEMFKQKDVDAEGTGFTPAQMYQFFGDSPLVEQPEQLELLAAQMREARERYNKIKEACGKRDDVEYYLVVFATVDDRGVFLDAVGLPSNRFVDGAALAAKFVALNERIAELEQAAAAVPAAASADVPDAPADKPARRKKKAGGKPAGG